MVYDGSHEYLEHINDKGLGYRTTYMKEESRVKA